MMRWCYIVPTCRLLTVQSVAHRLVSSTPAGITEFCTSAAIRVCLAKLLSDPVEGQPCDNGDRLVQATIDGAG